MPLTNYQSQVAKLLAQGRSVDSYLAGGAALHLEPNTTRYSNDLDYFHDSVERVASAFAADSALLNKNGYAIALDMQQPGYIRAVVSQGIESTKIEWAHDSAWRFLPVVADPVCGYRLHPIDLAINKLLALVGRDEPRDFLDILFAHKTILPICALCWAGVGKDPGFSPNSLLELLKRKGRYRPEDFARLRLTARPDLVEMKGVWLAALEEAARAIEHLRPEEPGCLFYSPSRQVFVSPLSRDADTLRHFGRPGGILPQIKEV
jgi:hypothetical protein